MKALYSPLALGLAFTLAATCSHHAALLAYEPFTNAPGTAIIGSAGGHGFNGAWQNYANSSGVATNTGFGLGYRDASGNVLVTAGGAGFFQGHTVTNGSMQPIRVFNFSRGTNGTDGVSTWISFIVVRQGPTGTLPGNPYGRGANVCHDINTGNIQKLAIGNSSGVATNTVGLIPQGSSSNLRSSTNTFGPRTNFVVVRIDHVSGGNDSAWLFVNPNLDTEPSTNAAGASSVGGFDFSFDRLRVFAGGNASADQPYAEMLVDEYRVGETYADVTPYNGPSNPLPPAPYVTNVGLTPEGLRMSGTNGIPNGFYQVVASPVVTLALSNWTSVATNIFGADGNFDFEIPISPGAGAQFYRLLVPAAGIPPAITAQPQDRTVIAGQNAMFTVGASGTEPLAYQWYFNGSVPLADATNATLVLTNVQTDDAGTYWVQVRNAAGLATSAGARLTVIVPPSITSQPEDQTLSPGQDASFSVVATGTAPLRYQWYFNTNTALANATNSSLLITNVQTTNSGTYSVVVTNSGGSVTSRLAVLTVNPLPTAPSITTQPQSQTVLAGQNATFSVSASGTLPLIYLWYFNTNTLLVAGTNSSLTITNAQTNNAGGYFVIVTNTVGSATSAVAMLTVTPTSAPPDFSLVGFATLGGGTTGGQGGTVTNVSTASAFRSVVGATGARIVQVQGTLNLGNTPVTVRSHKSIIGLGTNATLIGSLNLGAATNVIIRNLYIGGTTNDGVTIDGDGSTNTAHGNRIWIDHCTFFNCGDGNVDITKGADLVTISWCKFYFTTENAATNDHRFIHLIGASDSDSNSLFRVTFHHNWYSTNCDQRIPSVRFGRVHVFNNYYNCTGNTYCVRTRIGAEVLVENNYFENVNNAWERYITVGTPGKLWATNNILINSTYAYPGTDYLPFFNPVPYSYTPHQASEVKSIVMTYAGAGKGPFAP